MAAAYHCATDQPSENKNVRLHRTSLMVGATGIEPAASRSRTERTTTVLRPETSKGPIKRATRRPHDKGLRSAWQGENLYASIPLILAKKTTIATLTKVPFCAIFPRSARSLAGLNPRNDPLFYPHYLKGEPHERHRAPRAHHRHRPAGQAPSQARRVRGSAHAAPRPQGRPGNLLQALAPQGAAREGRRRRRRHPLRRGERGHVPCPLLRPGGPDHRGLQQQRHRAPARRHRSPLDRTPPRTFRQPPTSFQKRIRFRMRFSNSKDQEQKTFGIAPYVLFNLFTGCIPSLFF